MIIIMRGDDENLIKNSQHSEITYKTISIWIPNHAILQKKCNRIIQ